MPDMSQAPKRTHSWKRAKSDNMLLPGRSFQADSEKKAKVTRSLKLRKAKRRNSDDDCDDEAAKYNCMPQEVTKDGRLMLEVRKGKKRLQVWKACRVQLVMSTSYAMNTFGRKQFILMCITGGLLGLSKRYLSIPLADIHAIYKGGKEGVKPGVGQPKQSFVLQTSDKQLHFRAANDNDMLDWVAEVKASLAVEKANGFLPSIFHVRIGPDQQVPMTDALLAFHPHRNPEQLHIRQALSETTLYTCYIADILRFGFAHEGNLLWVEAQPRDSALATEKILLLCPNNSRPDMVQALQCNLQSVLGGAGNTIQSSTDHQTIYSVKDRFAITTGGGMRRRPLSINLGAQSHQPRGAIRRHNAGGHSPFRRARPLSETEAFDNDDDATGSDWRMDVQKHKEELVRHMHGKLLRKRSRSLGSIPTQVVPLALPARPRPAPEMRDGGPEPLEVFEEDAHDACHDSDSSDGCIRAAPAPKPPLNDQRNGGREGPSPPAILAQRIAKEAAEIRQNQRQDAVIAIDGQEERKPPVPPHRNESKHHRLIPLKKTMAVGAPLPPPPADVKSRLAAMNSREPCYGELESLASLGSSREVSPVRQAKNLLQVPATADNVSTSSEPYVYDHLEIKAAYEKRLREEQAQNALPPPLETIQLPASNDRMSVRSHDSWDDHLDYVPVSSAMMIKPASSEEDLPSAGEYCKLQDAPKREAAATIRQDQPAMRVPNTAAPAAMGRENCNSIFSCVSTIASSIDDISPSTSAMNNLTLDPMTGECDYDYPKSSRRATIVVSSPSSPSPSCSSLSGSNSMEDIAASLWRRKRANTAPSKRTLLPSGDTASFVGSLRKGANSANGGQQEKVIEDLLARLSPARCRSPYHSGIGRSPSSKTPSPPDERHHTIQSNTRLGANTLIISPPSDNPGEPLLSPRELTMRASSSCHDLLANME